MSLTVFGTFYGLDWLATVPPTLRRAPIVFGHQIGAACAASLAGALRQSQGSYRDMLVAAGITGIIAAFLALRIGHKRAFDRPLMAE